MAYFSVGPDVYRAVLDGTSPAERVTGTTGSVTLGGIALDPAHGRLFTSRFSSPAIEVASLAPGGPLLVVPIGFPGLDNPGAISIDPTAGRIYWGTEGNGTTGNLLSADVTGADTTTIGTPGTNNKRVKGLAVDPATRTIWWAQYTPSPAISWTRLDGSARGALDTTGATVAQPTSIAISHRANRAYWTNFWNVGTASLSGGAGFDIPSAMLSEGIAVDDSAGHIYWMEASGVTHVVTIRRSGLDGQGTVTVTPPGLPPSDFIAAVSLLFAPIQSAAPAVTGTAVVGSTLTCSPATWSADTPESFAFRAPETTSLHWTRDGQTIAGATGTTHQANAAGRYGCVSVATNAAGTTNAPSDELTVVVPTTPGAGSGATPAGGGTATPRALRATWTVQGRRASTAFTAPAGSTRFSITAQPPGAQAATARAESARARTGRCTAKGPRARRRVTCAIALPEGRWSVSTTAWAGSVATARTTRTVRVR